MLFIVEVVYYLVYVTQVGVAWGFFHYRDFNDPLRYATYKLLFMFQVT
ncbi:hypothetical protein IQ260_24135 [Leptolyngbya cf. ectocarpi LEGE 11479]|uniref:Uncharacterized protein n=1 Tax=Leptolyngbya cf. ectocarpi LEGE 11479 TaxID=1828722 RepID=A0A928ZYI9_LEPEC|nr:hypothetical protein [Leptolyngbya ectocarpi]MBE9069738.1 hypothetical protein [Leptolyngbya cf. ectocarpi LEGE 11479]